MNFRPAGGIHLRVGGAHTDHRRGDFRERSARGVHRQGKLRSDVGHRCQQGVAPAFHAGVSGDLLRLLRSRASHCRLVNVTQLVAAYSFFDKEMFTA